MYRIFVSLHKMIESIGTMKEVLFLSAAAALSMLFDACNPSTKKLQAGYAATATEPDAATVIQARYAKGFSVEYSKEGVRLIDIRDPQNEGEVAYRFALVSKGMKSVAIPPEYTAINVPIARCICMTSLQLSNFTVLRAHDFITGITGTKNLYNRDIHARVNDGRIVKIGMEGNFDAEIIMAANPDVIFISPFKRGGYEAIKETGITLIPHLGYKELDPLGQAEWIKFISLFIGKEKEANDVFDGIVARYTALKEKAAKVSVRPVVFSGEMHGGNWFAVGGRNYLAKMFEDAGADYVMKDNPSSGGVNMEYEKLYSIAADADYWRILNSFPGEFSYEALKASDPRNADFKAFQKKQVIYCNMQQSPYYEIAPVEPDVVLADFVYVFHPELLPADYRPTFYKILKQ